MATDWIRVPFPPFSEVSKLSVEWSGDQTAIFFLLLSRQFRDGSVCGDPHVVWCGLPRWAKKADVEMVLGEMFPAGEDGLRRNLDFRERLHPNWKPARDFHGGKGPKPQDLPQREQPIRKPISTRTRWRVLQSADFRCFYCGREAPEVTLEVDHVVPVVRGGSNDESNLRCACFDCNRGKAAEVI